MRQIFKVRVRAKGKLLCAQREDEKRVFTLARDRVAKMSFLQSRGLKVKLLIYLESSRCSSSEGQRMM